MKNQYYLHLSSPCGKLNIFTHIYTYLTFTSAKHLDTPGESTVKHIFLSSRLPPAVDFASWEKHRSPMPWIHGVPVVSAVGSRDGARWCNQCWEDATTEKHIQFNIIQPSKPSKLWSCPHFFKKKWISATSEPRKMPEKTSGQTNIISPIYIRWGHPCGRHSWFQNWSRGKGLKHTTHITLWYTNT